jgi:hypothetical protein
MTTMGTLQFLHNHVGYRPAARKCAWVQHDAPVPALAFSLVDACTHEIVHAGRLAPSEAVPGWKDRHFAAADFSAVERPGEYFLVLDTGFPPVVSQRFRIDDALFGRQMLSDVVHYFKSQRCTGLFDLADRTAPLLDTREPRDVHGGWYDASGDCSKYLSHLSYANFMNPQQTPLVSWALMEGRDRIGEPTKWFDERIVDEALHGADVLVRLQDPAGFFYMTVFDRWSKDEHQREICAYATQQGHKSADYAAGYRQGGGLAIAALARAAGLPRDGTHRRDDYLAAAIRGFDVLEARNADFLDDHRENLLDDYAALLAATELLARTGEARFRAAAQARVTRVAARQDEAGHYWCDDARTRSFFHASDAGLVHVALGRFLEVAGEDGPAADVARHALRRGLRFELQATHDGGPNPLGYPRQFVAMPGRAARTQFFVPHRNESGYWWQGENARLGSLATAARQAVALGLFDGHAEDDRATRAALARYAQDALDWILGANPFDACMLQGWGHHPPRYEPGYWNACGGVCNGITSGLDDEDDLDFRSPEHSVPTHSWRWTEQWLPHAAWLFAALAWGGPEPQRPSNHPPAGGS